MAVTRLTGLSTGIDTQSLVKQLMNAESLRMNKLKQQRQLLEWKQQSYRDVAASLKSFQSSMLDYNSATTLRLSTSYNAFTSSILSNGVASKAISVSAKDITGSKSFSLTVNALAKKDVYTGTTQNATFSASNKLEGLELPVYDAEGNPIDPSRDAALIKLDDSFTVSLDGAAAVTFTFDEKDIKDLQAVEGDAKAYAQKIKNIVNKKLSDYFKSDSNGQKVTASLDGGKLTFTAGEGHSVKVGTGVPGKDALVKMGFTGGGSTDFNAKTMLLTDSAFGFQVGDTISFTLNNKTFPKDETETFTVTDTTTVQELMDKVNKAGLGVTLSYDNLNRAFKLESNETGQSSQIKFGSGANTFFNKFGIDQNDTHQVADDAKFIYNNKAYSRESNTFDIDGVTITLTAEAQIGQTFNVELSRDTSKAMDTIKKFVEEYNKLVVNLNKLTNTARPKNSTYSYYEPLTDDEKSGMSENEIAKWEEKAKTGMLYRDDIVTSITRQMRSMLYEEVDLGDGNKISLSQIGITTSKDNGNIGMLKIDEKKLQNALDNNLEDVMGLFTKTSTKSGSTVKARNERLSDEGLGMRLNDIIENAVASGGSIYERAGLENTVNVSNNYMSKQLSKMDDKISDMVKYLLNKENYYYSMFSRMENAIAKSNSQGDALTSMLG